MEYREVNPLLDPNNPHIFRIFRELVEDGKITPDSEKEWYNVYLSGPNTGSRHNLPWLKGKQKWDYVFSIPYPNKESAESGATREKCTYNRPTESVHFPKVWNARENRYYYVASIRLGHVFVK